jgi:hypothetical protein
MATTVRPPPNSGGVLGAMGYVPGKTPTGQSSSGTGAEAGGAKAQPYTPKPTAHVSLPPRGTLTTVSGPRPVSSSSGTKTGVTASGINALPNAKTAVPAKSSSGAVPGAASVAVGRVSSAPALSHLPPVPGTLNSGMALPSVYVPPGFAPPYSGAAPFLHGTAVMAATVLQAARARVGTGADVQGSVVSGPASTAGDSGGSAVTSSTGGTEAAAVVSSDQSAGDHSGGTDVPANAVAVTDAALDDGYDSGV